MPTHTSGPRRRRKPRSTVARASAGKSAAAGAPPPPSAAPALFASSLGERPRAPWHPLPLAELLILAGAIGTALGLRRGFSGSRLMLAGVAAVGLGTLEFAWREHRSGFRSHTLLLSLLAVVVAHTATVLGVGAFASVPAILNAGLLALDVVFFLLLFKLLRARFLNARARRAAGR